MKWERRVRMMGRGKESKDDRNGKKSKDGEMVEES